MTQAAKSYGITLKGKARQFTPADFDQFDWILAMDRENYRDILWPWPPTVKSASTRKVRLMCDFCQHLP
jgi:protein-tyrosine phosphatase